ncbi:MAG TPA: hypothetical protein VFG20_02720, partial [Planctomycetaceae bacterium]|nr:hypothetical protein [Planctomycetaceae bacterium]
ISASVRELWEGQHPHREILVLTDGQRWPWRVDESAEWAAAVSLLRQSAVPPRVSVIVREPDQHDINDVGWNSASLSRERCAPGQSTVITGVLRNHSTQAQQRRVLCEINGRPSADHQREVRLLPEATAAITFDVTLPNTGRHSLRLCTEADAITGNDRVDFVAEVVAGVKVLLVDGTPSADPLRSEIFFARAALESHGGGNWIEASTVDWSLVPPETLSDFAAIVLANVPELNAEWVAKLQPFVNRGGAVIISLGDQAAEAFLPIEQQRWLPIESVAPSATASATHVDEASLTLPWWQRFRADHGGELGTVEFRRWWTVKLGPHSESEGPQTWARFKNGDPLLLAFRRGLGTVVIAMSPLDADGNSLPAKPDYVAWLHELLLAVSAPAQRRNIAAGELIPIPPALRRHQLTIIGPWGPLHRGTDPAAIMTRWPGIYVLGTEDLLKDPNGDPALLCGSATVEAFAAQTDPRESDLTTLTAADRAALTAAFPLQFVDDVTNWERQSAAEAPRQELASGLLWCVLIGLIAESLITCRRCQREKSAGSVN